MTTRAQLVFLGCVLLACARSPSTGPVPLQVTPFQGTPDAPVDVEITGSGFDPTVHADYATGSSVVDSRFTASLVPSSGGAAVALENVAWTPRRTLTARVPAGLPTGSYDLVVVDPSQRSGRLADGYRVVTAAESVTGFQVSTVDAQVAGIPFAAVITAVDVLGRTVDQFSGTVAVRDDTGTLSPTTLSLVRGYARGFFTVAALRDGDWLTVSDDQGRTGVSEPFDVRAGPPASVAFVTTSTLANGACSGPFEIEVRDDVGHPSPVAAPFPFRIDVAPSGAAAAFGDTSCATPAGSLSVAVGASRAAFRLRASEAGSIAVRVVPDAVPSAEYVTTVSP